MWFSSLFFIQIMKMLKLLNVFLGLITCPQVYSEQDTSKMPLELGSALSIDREAVDDPEIRVQVLDAIYMITVQVKFIINYNACMFFSDRYVIGS